MHWNTTWILVEFTTFLEFHWQSMKKTTEQWKFQWNYSTNSGIQWKHSNQSNASGIPMKNIHQTQEFYKKKTAKYSTNWNTTGKPVKISLLWALGSGLKIYFFKVPYICSWLPAYLFTSFFILTELLNLSVACWFMVMSLNIDGFFKSDVQAEKLCRQSNKNLVLFI